MSKAKILIVDDSNLILCGLRKVFENSDYNLMTAQSPEEAVRIIKNEQCFDIVYTDMIMPKMNGVELCREIKNISPETEVIVFSGTPVGLLENWQQFIDAGGRDEILRKPLLRQEVLKVTEKVLNDLHSKTD